MIEDVRLLAAGCCFHPEAMTLRGGSWSPCRFPAGFTLLVHRRHGAVLFDTGYSDHFMRATKSFPNKIYAMLTPPQIEEGQTACQQLKAIGIEPSDVRAIIVSHFHADHIAGLRDFRRAKIVCSQIGWSAVRNLRGLRALSKGFLPDLMPGDVEERLLFVESCASAKLSHNLSVFGKGRDILGDGTVFSVDLPGHTESQIGLLIEDIGKPLFLVADAAWSVQAIKTATPPPRVTTDFLGETKIYRRTLSNLCALMQSNPELTLIPSHCEINLNSRRKAESLR